MSVYVDPNLEWPRSRNWIYGSVSHMYADTSEELHRMAKKLSLKREWCSDYTQPGSVLLHYDLSPNVRIRAIKLGAVPVNHAHAKDNGYWRSLEERQAELEETRADG